MWRGDSKAGEIEGFMGEGLRSSQEETSAHVDETTLDPLAFEDFTRSILWDAVTEVSFCSARKSRTNLFT